MAEKLIFCPVCGGTGQMEVEIMVTFPCLNCHGEGRVVIFEKEGLEVEDGE